MGDDGSQKPTWRVFSPSRRFLNESTCWQPWSRLGFSAIEKVGIPRLGGRLLGHQFPFMVKDLPPLVPLSEGVVRKSRVAAHAYTGQLNYSIPPGPAPRVLPARSPGHPL